MDQLRALLRPLQTRIMGLVSRGVVQLTDDAKGVQTLQASVLKGEVREGVERFAEYGFRSRPLPPDAAGACEAVILFPGGARAHGLALGTEDRRHRPPELAAGEVSLYTDEGEAIRLGRGRVLRIEADSLEIAVGSTTITVDGSGVSIDAGSGDFEVDCGTFRVNAPSVEFNP